MNFYSINLALPHDGKFFLQFSPDITLSFSKTNILKSSDFIDFKITISLCNSSQTGTSFATPITQELHSTSFRSVCRFRSPFLAYFMRVSGLSVPFGSSSQICLIVILEHCIIFNNVFQRKLCQILKSDGGPTTLHLCMQLRACLPNLQCPLHPSLTRTNHQAVESLKYYY